jgi:hypothetical protein
MRTYVSRMTKSRHFPRPSASMAVALLSLSIAVGGTGYAASQLPRNSVGTPQLKNKAVTSPKVKNHTLVAEDFKAGTLLQGPAGPVGPSEVYTKTFPTKFVTNGQFEFAALTLPAGSYFVMVRANAANGGAVPTRLECVLRDVAHPELDFFKTGLAAATNYPLQYDSLAMAGAVTLAAGGVVQATCGSADNTSVELITARMTAVRVGSMVVQ